MATKWKQWFRKSTSRAGLPTRQVDRLVADDPRRVAVKISSLPDKRDDLVALYSGIFCQRGYALTNLHPSTTDESPDLWTATFERRH